MISAIMPVYNAAEFLRDSIESALNQTEKDFELVIVNDGSTDESENIILSYADPRIIYIKQDNAGEAAARNTGLSHAKGDFIVWQDADDISLPSRFEILKIQFTSPSIGFVHSDMLLIDEQNRPISYFHARGIEKARMLRFFLKIGTPFNNASMMLRREMINGFSYDTTLRIGTDSDMVFQLASNWNSVHVPEPLYLYRRHTNNATAQSNTMELVFVHVRKFLGLHSLEELIPELDWENGDPNDNEARGCAIMGLFLYRRMMSVDAQAWLDRAQELAKSINSTLFVRAIINLIIGDYEEASRLLASCSSRDQVVENYLGEAYASMGNVEQAYKHFMRAIGLSPNYEEPIENLRALGGFGQMHLVDISWRKFLNAISAGS